jgi:alpha-beta hydrolase superfamily lysophospholipase
LSRVLASCALLALAAGARAAPAKTVRFKTADGWTIAGRFHAPRGTSQAAVLVHGVAAGKGEWDALTRELWKRGLGTLAIDLRGHGESTSGPAGKADYSGFDASGEWPRARADVAGALAYLERRGLPASRVGLIGASVGANLVSQAAVARPGIPWIVLLSPGLDYRGVALAALSGRKVLVAAAASDPYAYQTTLSVSAVKGGPARLEAREGHGAQMCGDPAFEAKLVDWIVSAAQESSGQ